MSQTRHATQDAPTVGWIGTGKMGGPMARNLLQADIPLMISEPVAASRDQLTDLGARAAGSLYDFASTTIVFSTLPNDQALLEVVLRQSDPQTPGLADTLPAGAVLVEMSTVSPECSELVASRLKTAGVRYVRAPLSGSTDLAAKASLTVLASGDRSGWDEVLPYLEKLSARQFYLGEGEEARYMKLVLNTLVGASSAILSEALSIGASGGLTRSDMMEVICESAVASPLLKYKQETVVSGDYAPAFTVSQMIKDFTLISEAARRNNVPLMTTGLILELYRSASNAGMQDEDFFALVKWQEKLSTR
ncbi:NAD(P)-dependent oxidoreductase [Pseudooceanicola onchidii]|uniref:NAD(P)-dependent oxidoreductase n=1 Tax=Pseudooceanicola onchidii TaxID=2562279 RepID=UPI00145C01BC|nr:NAD(P)-dependent oxidoreductase [Pseudooceanicola onchidii]